MIVYKVDKQSQTKASTHIRDMATVLAEIGPTLKVLQETIVELEAGISSPSINHYRNELQQMIDQAIGLTHTITENSQKLAAVSDQATKHVVAIENHFDSILRAKES